MNQKLYTLEHIPSHITPDTKVLFMLHGVGSNEIDLFGLKQHFPDTYIFSLRGPYSRGGGYAWYPVDFSSGTARYNWNDVLESISQIQGTITTLREKYDFKSEQIYLLGFSQGAIMSIVYSLIHPSDIGGIVALSGRLLEEVGGLEISENIKDLRIFLGHGMMDSVIHPSESEKTRSFLEKHTEHIIHKTYSLGHSISGQEISDIANFLYK